MTAHNGRVDLAGIIGSLLHLHHAGLQPPAPQPAPRRIDTTREASLDWRWNRG